MVQRSLLCYEAAYKGHFRRILWRFAEDGISYAEIRLAMNYMFTIQSDDGTREYGHGEIMQMLADVLKEETPKIQASGLTFYGVRIIYAVLRGAPKEAMKWCMDTCIELKQKFPDLICGRYPFDHSILRVANKDTIAFDMQGQEDLGHPLTHWIPELLEMRAKIRTLGLDLPFIFHAGETLDHGGDTDSNLFDAILLGTKRIGHGFSLIKHPLLMQLCKERNIAIETCPLSNEVLGLCPTTKTHHLPILLSNCIPCTINSDDPGSWGFVFLISRCPDSHEALHEADTRAEQASFLTTFTKP